MMVSSSPFGMNRKHGGCDHRSPLARWWTSPGEAATRYAVAACLIAGTLLGMNARGLADEPTAAQRTRAKELMLEGRVRRHDHDLRAALDMFRQAHVLVPVPTTALEMARTQAELGMLVEARATLREVAEFPKNANEPEPFMRARAEALQLDADVAKRVATLHIACRVPAGASCRVSIDGGPAMSTSQEVSVELNPGSHRLVTEPAPRPPMSDFDLLEGEFRKVELQAPPATITVPSASSSQHASVRAPSAIPWAPASDPPRPLRMISWGGVAVGGAALTFGVITGLIARSTVHDLNGACPDYACPSSESDRIGRAHNLSTASTVGFAVGGVLVAAGVVGLLWSTHGEANSKPSTACVGPQLKVDWSGARLLF